MRRTRKKWIIILIVSVLLFVIAILITSPPKSYRATKGPSTEFLKTEGVFKPGGYIKFEFSPEIKSLKGYNKGSVNVYPLNPENVDTKFPVWAETGFIAFGRNWGGSMSGSDKSMKVFTIKHRMEIPADDELAGIEVVMLARYSMTYPVFVGAAPGVNRYTFRDESKNMDEYIIIQLKNETFTQEEMAYKDKINGILGIFSSLLILVSIFAGFIALIRIFIPANKKVVRSHSPVRSSQGRFR